MLHVVQLLQLHVLYMKNVAGRLQPQENPLTVVGKHLLMLSLLLHPLRFGPETVGNMGRKGPSLRSQFSTNECSCYQA